jgi:hypothetical protein
MSTDRTLVEIAGGLPMLRHSIEDVGFREVQLFEGLPPVSWLPRARLVPVTFPEWLLWVEAVPTETATVRADIAPGALITDAYTVGEPTAPTAPTTPSSPGSPSPGPASAEDSSSTVIAVTVGILLLSIAGGLAYLAATQRGEA